MTDSSLPPPPSYDDVIASGTSAVVETSLGRVAPTAPQSTAVFNSSTTGFLASGRRMSEQRGFAPPGGRLASGTSSGSLQAAQQQGRLQPRTATPIAPPQTGTLQFAHTQNPQSPTPPRQRDNLMDKFAKFSMPTLMLMGYSIMGEDPELDTEAHIGTTRQRSIAKAKRRSRLRCWCSCLWCVGFLLLFLFIALPAAMILTGLFGQEDCTYNSSYILLLLYLGGAILALTVALRLFTSGLSCCKVSNAFDTENSVNCSLAIAILEGLFGVILVASVIVFAVGAWLLLAETPPEEGTDLNSGFCTRQVYLTSVSFLVGGLGLGLMVLVYLLVAAVVYFLYYKDFAAHKYAKSSQRPHHQRTRTF